MDVHLLNLLSSFGPVGLVIALLYWKSKTFEEKHTEAMMKLDALTQTNANIEKQLAVFGVKLDHGDERFMKNEGDIKQLRDNIHELRNNIHSIRNKMVTKDILMMMKDMESNQGNKNANLDN